MNNMVSVGLPIHGSERLKSKSRTRRNNHGHRQGKQERQFGHEGNRCVDHVFLAGDFPCCMSSYSVTSILSAFKWV